MKIKIDSKSSVPVYEQVKTAIKFIILSGKLKQDERLLSIRELALKLKINPNTIIKVYYQLEVEGFIYSRPGSGYFVKLDLLILKQERIRILENETDDYLEKAFQLGYSLDELIRVLKRRSGRIHPEHSSQRGKDD